MLELWVSCYNKNRSLQPAATYTITAYSWTVASKNIVNVSFQIKINPSTYWQKINEFAHQLLLNRSLCTGLKAWGSSGAALFGSGGERLENNWLEISAIMHDMMSKVRCGNWRRLFTANQKLASPSGSENFCTDSELNNWCKQQPAAWQRWCVFICSNWKGLWELGYNTWTQTNIFTCWKPGTCRVSHNLLIFHLPLICPSNSSCTVLRYGHSSWSLSGCYLMFFLFTSSPKAIFCFWKNV